MAYRRVLTVTILVAALVTGAVMFLFLRQDYATVKVRLVFDGAKQGMYPSGLKFSQEDILTTAVLDQAYKENDLGKVLKFDEFRRAMSISSLPSPELAGLEAEYHSKLANPKLTVVERTQLEKEYGEKKQGLEAGTDYMLAMDLSNPALAGLPRQKRADILSRILAIWADDAAVRKGVTRYQVNIPSRNILVREFIMAEDYMIAADMLRNKLLKLRSAINELMELPGARTFQAADKKLALGEVRASLEDLYQFKVSPLINTICMTGLSRNPDSVLRYFQGKTSESALATHEATSRVKVLTDALAMYQKISSPVGMLTEGGPPGLTGTPSRRTAEAGPSTVIPQVSEDFLDRVVALANQSGDAKFRQNMIDKIAEEGAKVVDAETNAMYYKDVLDRLMSRAGKEPAVPGGDRKGQDAQTVEKQLAAIFDQLVTATEQIQAIYLELSARNLNPRVLLYTITEPATVQHAVSSAALLRQSVKIVALVAILAVLICLIHARLTADTSRRSAPGRAK